MKKGLLKVVVFMVLLVTLSGCYFNNDVGTNQVGVMLQRNAIVSVVPPGVYTDWSFFSDLKQMDVNTQTFTVEDPEVLTSDNQAVGLKVTIQARRNADNESVRNLVTNWSTLMDNNIMIETISSTAREGMKNGVRAFNLTTLLDDRNKLADAIRTQLEIDTAKYGVEIVNVTIENVALDPAYTGTLNEKALLRVQTEKEKERQLLIKQQADNDKLQAQQTTIVIGEQIIQAKAQTELEVAIAAREGQKIAEANKVYTLNPQAFELEKMRLAKYLIGDKTVFYIPAGTSITQFVGDLFGKSVIPVQ